MESELQWRNRKFNCHEKIILKASNNQSNTFRQALDHCQNIIDQIYSNYIQPLSIETRIRTVIDHPAFDSAINFPFMKKSYLTHQIFF